jgi:putative acetyltransferase
MERGRIDIREARREDAPYIARVHELAFGQPNESRLVEAIGRSGVSVISIVATIYDRAVGHILFSPVTIDVPGPRVEAVGLAPLAVLPDFQRRGIGSLLISHGLEAARRRGAHIVVVVGHPGYYQRFGFRPARELGLRSEYPEVGDAFMALELTPAVLEGRGEGLARYRPEFADV